MTTYSQTFGSATSASESLSDLPSGTRVVTAAIDNSSTGAFCADITVHFKTGSHIGPGGAVTVGIFRSLDNSTYENHLSNANIILNYKGLTANSEHVLSASTDALGPLPKYFKIAVRNTTGSDFATTTYSPHIQYQLKCQQSA